MYTFHSFFLFKSKKYKNNFLFPDNNKENSSEEQTVIHEQPETNITSDSENNVIEIQGK